MSRGLLLSCLALTLSWPFSASAVAEHGVSGPRTPVMRFSGLAGGRSLLLAEDTGKAGEAADQPKPGELVIPQDSLKGESQDEGEKKCMTVCVRWGEECMLINKGAGGMERRCRRTCQQFGEECL